ncbi:G-protein coupled receptor 4-like [Micropterus salmoides]|uniref:G-protein coupled receptor 4-like n=1 Tax=Micropterus salmoides TaxID=27706 RepID=UPI0018EB82B9|nr:G-protein coupled receptor 4-like [Micropterus salmoides]
MEGLYSNSTLPDQSFNYSNITCNYQKSIHEYLYNEPDVIYVVTCVTIVVGLPLTLVAIYALYSMVRSDHVAPIYVINLLITDLLQLCCMIVEVAPPEDEIISVMSFCIYVFSLFTSVYFMVCISLERYLVIAHRCGTASDEPSRVLWWSVSWSGSFLLFVLSFSFSFIWSQQ